MPHQPCWSEFYPFFPPKVSCSEEAFCLSVFVFNCSLLNVVKLCFSYQSVALGLLQEPSCPAEHSSANHVLSRNTIVFLTKVTTTPPSTRSVSSYPQNGIFGHLLHSRLLSRSLAPPGFVSFEASSRRDSTCWLPALPTLHLALQIGASLFLLCHQGYAQPISVSVTRKHEAGV